MKSKGVIIWVGGFVGVLLLYAAYKSSSSSLVTPWKVLSSGLGGGGSVGVSSATPPVAPVTAQMQPSVYTGPAIGSQVDTGFGTVPVAYQHSQATYLPSTADENV